MAGPEHSEAPQAVLDPQLELQGVCEEQSQASHQTAGVTSDAAAQQQLIAQIVEQVNFYFGDTNLPTDAFLLKEIRKSPDGWVPVRLIASFKRMKALSTDQAFIVAALQKSSELELSGHRVRRRTPLREVDGTEVLLRTVLAENLPDQSTIDSLTSLFSPAGTVNMVRICQPGGGPRSVAQTVHGADLAVSRQLHALVEFSSQVEAAAAVKQLTDSNNWRSGLKVRPLLRTAYQPKQKQPQQLRKSSKPQQPADSSQHSDSQHTQNRASSKQLQASPHAADQSANGRAMPGSTAATAEATAELAHLSLQSPSTCDVDSQSAPHEASDHDQSHHQHQGPPSEGPADASGSATREQAGQSQQSSKGRKAKKSKRDYAAWAGATAETRALATAHHDGNPDLEPPVVPSARPRIIKQNTPAAPGSQPLGPNGSKGFAMGRGRGITVPLQCSPS